MARDMRARFGQVVILAALLTLAACGGGGAAGSMAGSGEVVVEPWARGAGGTALDYGQSVAALADGSCVVAGNFESGSIVFGDGEPNETTLTPAGQRDIFLARYASDGSLAWARSDGGTGVDYAQSVAARADGVCVMTGAFSGSAVFGAGELNETTLTSAGAADVFVARYASDGSLAWARSAGGMDYDQGFSVAVLADGSCVVTGAFGSGGAVFGAGEPNATTLTSVGQHDVFLARYAPDGSLAWARSAGGMDYDQGWGVAMLADGSCVMTGFFASSGAVFGAGEPNETTLTSLGQNDVFLARYASDGSLAWARSAGGVGSDVSAGVAVLADGSCVVTGRMASGGAVFGAGEPNETTLTSLGFDDAFLARYAPDGNLAWARSAGGAGGDWGQSVAALADGSCVVAGTVTQIAVFGAGEPNETLLRAAGDYDVFLARYEADGTLAWVRHDGGAAGSRAFVGGLAAGADGSYVMTGNFVGVMIFGEGGPNAEGLFAVGNQDVFVARFSADGGF